MLWHNMLVALPHLDASPGTASQFLDLAASAERQGMGKASRTFQRLSGKIFDASFKGRNIQSEIFEASELLKGMISANTPNARISTESVTTMDVMTGVEDPLTMDIQPSLFGDILKGVGRGLIGGLTGGLPGLIAGVAGGGSPGQPAVPTAQPTGGGGITPAQQDAVTQLLQQMGVGMGVTGVPQFNAPAPFIPQAAPTLVPQATGPPMTNALAMPSVVAPTAAQRLTAPAGYVIVTIPYSHPTAQQAIALGGAQTPEGVKVAMLKPMARRSGLWKARQKPLLTASDGRIIKKAARLRSKLRRTSARSGVVVTTKEVAHFKNHRC